MEKYNRIKGGLSDKKELNWYVKKCGKEKFLSELKKGLSIELEHTTNVDIACEIALDHLAENCNYYSILNKVENMNENVSFKNELDEFGKYGSFSCENDGTLLKNGNVVGTCDFQLLRNKNVYYIFLASIIIDDKFRGKGLFKSFINQMIRFADNNNLDISLEATSTYGSNILRLKDGYRKLGFSKNNGQYSGNMVRRSKSK